MRDRRERERMEGGEREIPNEEQGNGSVGLDNTGIGILLKNAARYS
jgi:hypothetical protein